jgi:hypothetical protein
MIYAMRDLRYYLIEGKTACLENFEVLDRQERVWHEAEVCFYALCTSHAVSLRWQDYHVTELLSCRGSLKLNPALAEIAATKPFEMNTSIQGVRYRFQLQIERLRGNDGLLGDFGPGSEIGISYPKIPGLDTPVTKIGWRIEPGVLRVETLHTYPEEASAVRSVSTFEIAWDDQVL